MKESRLLTISAPTPYERGLQYGQQAKKESPLCVETYRNRFAGTRGLSWEEAREISWMFIPYIEAEMPDMLEELKGIAAGAQTDLKDLMVLNCRYEILHFPHENECTAFALQREATANHHVYIGQNWDNRPTLLPHSLLLHITEEETGRKIFGLTEAGQLIRNGFTSRGVGQCSNSLRSCLDVRGAGIPSTFVRRKLLTLDRLEDMVALIRRAPRSVSVNYCIASRENAAADIEAVPGQPVRFDPTNGILTHANHLLVNRDLDVSTAKRFRGERLYELLSRLTGKITTEYIMECLRDHEGYPQSLCSHVTENGKLWQTNASLIYDLDEQRAWVCYGPPCEGEYKEYSL